jgi:hypothetical protein
MFIRGNLSLYCASRQPELLEINVVVVVVALIVCRIATEVTACLSLNEWELMLRQYTLQMATAV